MKHLIAVLFEVESPNYDEANRNVRAWVQEHREGHTLDVWPEGTQNVQVVQSFGEANGKRVLYLPSEGIDVEEEGIEVSFEEDAEEDEEPYNGFPD